MATHRRFSDRSTVTGSIPSKKSIQHMVHYRGLLQRAYIYLLEYNKDVLCYQERPFAIPYQRANQTAHYAPDFHVIWKDQPPHLVTCAHEASDPKPSTLAQWTAAQLWCNQHHHTFTLITWEVLRPHKVLLANLERLAVHSFLQIPPQTYDYTQKIILSFGGPFRVSEIIQHAPLIPPLQLKSLIWKLVYEGELLTDLTQPLHLSSTLLTWNNQSSQTQISTQLLHTSFP